MLGSVVPTIGGIDKAFYWADLWDCEAVQIYLTLSRTWKVNELTDKQIQNFKYAWKKSNIKEVVSHIPYLINLASSNQETREKSIERLVIEIERAELLGVKYLILHPGSYGEASKEKGMQKIIDGLNFVLAKTGETKAKILLETMAGQGRSIGSSFNDLKQIIDNVKSTSPNGIFVCLDTCHIFAAGYDIRTEKEYQKTLAEFDAIIGIDKIKTIHFNDSKTELGSRIDRHANIGEGKIGLSAFNFFMNDKRFKKIPKILETPDIKAEPEVKIKKTIKLLRAL